MLGDITVPKLGSKCASEANISEEEKSQTLRLPNKGTLCERGHSTTVAAITELEPSWPGLPQSLSLVLYNPIMFPAKGLSRSSCSEGQEALLVAHSVGVPQAGGRKQSPQGPSGVSSGQEAAEKQPCPGRVEATLTQLWGSSCAPGSSSPTHPPWRPALGEAERKSRLFWMPQAGSATVISFMCHRWL